MRTPLDFRRFFSTVDFQQHEAIGAVLWDRQLYTSASTVNMLFFQQVRTLKRDGNIQIGSQLPAGIHFLVQAIRIVPIARPWQSNAKTTTDEGAATGIADDLAQLYNDGVFTMSILNKQYAEYPMFLLLPGTGVLANQATLTTTALVSNYIASASMGMPDNRSVYTLAQPIAIPPLTTLQVRIDWASALTLEAGNISLQVVLDGQLIRPKQ